jgi:hypothetical protein
MTLKAVSLGGETGGQRKEIVLTDSSQKGRLQLTSDSDFLYRLVDNCILRAADVFEEPHVAGESYG